MALPEEELVLLVLKNTFDQKEIEEIVTSWLHDFLSSISDLEMIGETDLQFFIFFSAMKELSSILENVTKRENLLKLLDKPRIFQYVKKKIPPLKGAFERQLQALSVSVSILDGIQKVLDSIEPGELASEKLDEFLDLIVPSESAGG